MKTIFKTLIVVLLLGIGNLELVKAQSFHNNKFIEEKNTSQLIVIPRNSKHPVPYEVIRTWETGHYSNFFKLPKVNGNIEPRLEFNKNYGVYALEWLSLIRQNSKKLYSDILKAAKITKFFIVNEYITWDHKPYPEGEVSSKKYEKAAFYKGEIILSAPVMDKVGPLNNHLTASQNQGFVIIHELINAAYPNLEVAEKLKIGEAIIRLKLFNESKNDFIHNLADISDYFITLDQEKNDFITTLNDLIERADKQQKNTLQTIKEVGVKYGYSDDKIHNVFLNEVLSISKNEVEPVQIIQNRLLLVHKILVSLNFDFGNQTFFNSETLIKISKHLSIPIDLLYSITDPLTSLSVETEIHEAIIDRIKSEVLVHHEEIHFELLKKYNKNFDLKSLLYLYQTLLTNLDYYKFFEEDFIALLKNKVVSELKVSNALYIEAVKLTQLENGLNFQQEMSKQLNNFLCMHGYCVDQERTVQYFDWIKNFRDPMVNIEFPFLEGQKFITLDHHGVFEVIVADLNDKTIVVRNPSLKTERRKYSIEEVKRKGRRGWSSFGFSDLSNLFFLK
jgi:hypothetical protein